MMIYYDNAATTCPKPPQVVRAVCDCLTAGLGNPGRGGHEAGLRASRTVYEVRERVASFFGLADPERVVFTLNATHALNTALLGLLHPGDHVLYSAFAHNAVRRPILSCAASGTAADCYPVTENGKLLSDAELLSGLEKRIRSKTRLIAATHLSNICSAVLPIRKIGELCRKHGILFLVDASQSAGILPIDMERDRIDYLCAPGHKSLYGPCGCGILLIAPHAPIPDPLVSGGTGVMSRDGGMPDFLPERLEAGTPPLPAIAGLGAGISFLTELGQDAVTAHHTEILQRLREILASVRGVTEYCREAAPRSSLLFRIGGLSSETAARLLDEHGIAVRAGLHCAPTAHEALGTAEDGAVRISVGMFSTRSETDAFASCLREIVQ